MKDWLKNKEKFENLDSSKLSLTTLHKGSGPKYPDTYNKLIDYIEFNRKLGLPITTWPLLLKFYKYEPERKDLSINANLQLLYRVPIEVSFPPWYDFLSTPVYASFHPGICFFPPWYMFLSTLI